MNSQYQFPSDVQQRVDAYVSAGAYQSPDDVLRAAIQALDELDREKLRLFQELNRIAEEQSRLGLSKPLNLPALLERVEGRVAAASRDE